MKSFLFVPVFAVVIGITESAGAGCCDVAKPMADQAAVAPAAKEQATCPVTGEKIDKSVYVDYEGQRVYFCCGACKGAFAKSPGKYIKQMEMEGVQPEKVPARN